MNIWRPHNDARALIHGPRGGVLAAKQTLACGAARYLSMCPAALNIKQTQFNTQLITFCNMKIYLHFLICGAVGREVESCRDTFCARMPCS